MKIIKEEITAAQRRLSGVNTHFLEFVKKNPGSLERRNYSNLLKHQSALGNIQPWPIFINQQTRNRMKAASTTIFHLIKQIPERLFANNLQKISTYYGSPVDYTRVQLEGLKPGAAKNLLARGDFIFSPSGLKCIEYNISAGIGGWQVAILESMYINTPVIAKFLQKYKVKIHNRNLFLTLLQHLLKAALDKFSHDSHHEINIAIVIPEYEKTGNTSMEEKYFNHEYQRLLNAKYNYLHGEAVFCDFPHLTVAKDCIFYKEKRIHVLLELYHGEIPFEILLVSLVGNVILYNGPVTKLLSDKLNHALLSENEDSQVFSLEEREAIKKYIPRTRRIVPGKVTFGRETVHLEDFLLSHRVKWVIKSSREKGGKDIHIGKLTPARQWEQVVKQALQDNDKKWIAQEYVESCPFVFQHSDNGYTTHDVIWGLFVFGSEYAGGFLRLLPKNNITGIINTARGAEKTVIFEVDG